MIPPPPSSTLFPYTTLFRSSLIRRSGRFSLRPRAAGQLGNVGRLQKMRFYMIANSFQRKRSEEHTSELQSHSDLVCRLLLEKKKKKHIITSIKDNLSRMSSV